VENISIAAKGSYSFQESRRRVSGIRNTANNTYQPLYFLSSAENIRPDLPDTFSLAADNKISWYKMEREYSLGAGYGIFHFFLTRHEISSPLLVKLVQKDNTSAMIISEGKLSAYSMDFIFIKEFEIIRNWHLSLEVPLAFGTGKFANDYFSAEDGILINYGINLMVSYLLADLNSFQAKICLGIDWKVRQVYFGQNQKYLNIKKNMDKDLYGQDISTSFTQGKTINVQFKSNDEIFFPFISFLIIF
jgi:hypothetical protein